MMYSEFLKGTGCRENENNYKVFERLEILYMNSDMTKEEIYEYGKKLVDNSKTELEVAKEKAVKDEINKIKDGIRYAKGLIAEYQNFLTIETDINWIKEWKRLIKVNRDCIKIYNLRIKELKESIA